ncbi:aldehyde dehydrogenase family protein [Kitasatospora sp. GP82]|uniref:aldehyde dehydrogenase family protein n=1 Tax=Kitasatospora sp. GP82 TaxID=3035089 RepID=UPI00247646A2|nr:aldehyde dehydrogenase family protein [Kitasatospora sp. GP82]MDH6125825.1 phenylacetate-coenzyme A ligase PaaK-like adenylate-forming protein [Kitasatospora sp. GP82]
MTTAPHFWQGSFIDDAEAARRLAELPALAEQALTEVLSTETVLSACAALGAELGTPGSPVHTRLAACLTDGGSDPEEAAATLAELAAALGRPALERKLRRELGGPNPERFTRPDARETVFEAWAPVGLLVHIAPGNAAAVAPLSVVEGLLTGNLNVLKTSSTDTLLAQHLLAELADADPTGVLARRTVVLRFPSARKEWLQLLCAAADAVAVWGGEDAVQAVSELVTPGCRLVEWGHRISFAYLTRDAWSDQATQDALAADICRFEQQACSSPQVVYLDTDDADEVFAFAESFAARLAEASAKCPRPELEAAEHAEITTTELIARLEQHLGLTKVVAADDGSWRVLADTRSALAASPLHRSIWVKPLPRTAVMATLRPMRRYLQTVAIGGSRTDIARLSQAVIAAGALRVTPVGAMLDSYHGEPHDGVYALQRYSRRVGVQADAGFGATACLDDLVAPAALPAAPTGPLLDKAGVQEQLRTLAAEHAHLYFRSGGTTGAPALSVFTNGDYDTQMRAAADGLLAAGFDPAHDRAANLFYCGGMYGSFISFFSILERLNATQIPMAAGPDHAATAQALVMYRADTLFGMPSYLWQLFHSQGELLREYGGIRKVFYGGEHFTAEQRRVLTEDFGVQVIRSAAYGSTDLGPLGYQCTHSEGSVHHVLTDLHTLEILDPAADLPVPTGQPGRLVFTSRTRAGQRLERYQIGDLGRALEGVCPCGSHTPRIELLGRYGDVVRVGTYFYNYRRFVEIAEEELGYRGELQLVLAPGEDRERLTVRLDERYAPAPDAARTVFLTAIADLGSAVAEGLLTCTVETADTQAFERTPTSGKLRAVIDRRPATA